MDIYSVLILLGFIACCFLAALTGALFRPGEWYQHLAKPSWRRDADGNLYIVRHDEPRDEWELTMFEPDAPAHGMAQEVRERL